MAVETMDLQYGRYVSVSEAGVGERWMLLQQLSASLHHFFCNGAGRESRFPRKRFHLRNIARQSV